MRTVTATRYVTPLREGGSVPAIMEADDDGTYVVKFRGAAQGPRALIAELVAGEIGRTLGLRVPELVFVEVDPALGRSEPDPEIQALVTTSGGLNLALDYLPGSVAFDPAATKTFDPAVASAVVWFDAYVTNVDRTARNTNLLLWHKQLWLIDHGATLYFHHTWNDYLARSQSAFTPIKDHVLLRFASTLSAADEACAARLTPTVLREIVELIPEGWLEPEAGFASPAEHRAAYVEFLLARLAAPRRFVEEASHAHAQLV